MEPRIEYENPLAAARPERIAGGEKIRREDRKQKSNAHRKKSRKDAGEPQDDNGVPGDRGSDDDGKLGKRIDLEA